MITHFYIYMTTNVLNGHRYIGKRQCRCDIEDDNYLGSGSALRNAIKKHGKDNFKKEILEICSDAQHCDEREKYWISLYDAVHDKTFYNIAAGGEGGNTYEGLSAEELQRISEIKSQKSKGENNPRYRANVTAEIREKISAGVKRHYQETGLSSTSGKFGALNKLSKKIWCIELNRLFDGIREASRMMNIPMPNLIRSLKSNGHYSAGKDNGKRLHWIYA